MTIKRRKRRKTGQDKYLRWVYWPLAIWGAFVFGSAPVWIIIKAVWIESP